MKLMIRNFAKIKQAEIQIDGITVIAGENNTGKSTVGKILYSLFNSVSNIEEKIERQRRNEFQEVCRTTIRNYYAHNLAHVPSSRVSFIVPQNVAVFAARELTEHGKLDQEKLAKKCEKELAHALPKAESSEAAEIISEMLPKVLAIAELPLDRIYRTLITQQFEAVFSGQVSPLLDTAGETTLELIIKGKRLSVALDREQCSSFSTEYNIIHHALYLDNPFVLDDLDGDLIYLSRRSDGAPKQHIREMLTGASAEIKPDLLETIVAREKLSEIERVLNDVVGGEVIQKRDNGYYLNQSGMKEPVAFNNLSTGLKSFVLLKMLIENGTIKEKDVLIFDEPEIHLHPQWQLAYAELIVLMQKYFDLSIVVTTHSPYFLDALNLYSVKHDIAPKANYYLSALRDGYASFENVTGNLECLYQEMATPIKALDELRYTLSNQ